MSNEYRIVVVGSGGVGKSALTVRFIQGNFIQKYDPTIEDSYRRMVEVDNKACILDIMDTAGQDEYSALRDQYMKSGEGFLLVYSITSQISFICADKMHENIVRLKELAPGIPIIIIGNKQDLEHDREVSSEEGQKFATSKGAGFLETSAKTNLNVTEMFMDIARRINEHRKTRKDWNTDENQTEHRKRKFCILL